MPTPDASMSYARAVDVLLFGDASAELQMVQRQRLQSLSLHHRIGDRSGAAGLAATLQMMAGMGDAA